MGCHNTDWHDALPVGPNDLPFTVDGRDFGHTGLYHLPVFSAHSKAIVFLPPFLGPVHSVLHFRYRSWAQNTRGPDAVVRSTKPIAYQRNQQIRIGKVRTAKIID